MSRRPPVSLAVVALLFLLPVARDAWASWPSSPASSLPICVAPGGQVGVLAVTDGAGGAIFCWQDSRSGTQWELYAQRVDADGRLLWGENGLPVSEAAFDRRFPVMVSDGQGGAIVAWVDLVDPSGDVYAQRLGPDGERLWGSGGVAVCATRHAQGDLALAADGTGGAVVAWCDDRMGSRRTYAQKVSPDGAKEWEPSGVAVGSDWVEQWSPVVLPDGAGGAFVVWMRLLTNGRSDVYAQRLDAEGRIEWGPGGAIVCDAPSTNNSIACVPDGSGGLIVVFDDDRSWSLDLYGQRLNRDGARIWDPAGVRICDAPQIQREPLAVADGAGGALLTWHNDFRSGGNTVHAQRVDAAGGTHWTDYGIAVGDGDALQSPAIDGDGAGGVVFAWTDLFTGRLYAQRLDATGTRLWERGGEIVTDRFGQDEPAIVWDGAGRAIVAWVDRGGEDWDIRAQRVPYEPAGLLVRRVEFSASAREVTIWWELDGWGNRPIDVERRSSQQEWATVGHAIPLGEVVRWIDSQVTPGERYVYRLVADAGLRVGEVVVDVPLSDEAPSQLLVRSIESTASPREVRIRWEVAGFGDRPIEVERRSTQQEWSTIGRATPQGEEVRWIDSQVTPGMRYVYRLASGALEKIGEIAVDVPLSEGLELIGTRPHPARNGVLRLELSLAGGQPAVLEVFDLSGRRIVSRPLAAGSAGRRVIEVTRDMGWAPGVYVVRLAQAGRATSTRVVVAP